MNQADLLLTNAFVVTMNEAFDLFPDGAVAIAGEKIVAVGPEVSIRAEYSAHETVDCGGRVLIPGLINAHTHAPMTLLRGLADDLRLDVWLLGYMMPVEREFVSPDYCRLGTFLACAEMIRSGVTCFADMYYFEADVARATAEAGLRAVCSQTVLKFPSPDAASYEDSLAAARDFIQEWKGHPLIVPSVAPHAPYTSTPDILRACAHLAAEFDVPLHTHIAETALEVQNSRAEHGMPVVPWVKKHDLFQAKVLAAHCVHIDEGEIRSLHGAGAGVAHNPSSNLKLASGVAPVQRMLEIGLNVGIGTDGPASNNDLDMFEETRLAAFLAKGSTGDPTVLPARAAFLMATRMGAHALHLGHLTGSLEPGKRADLALVDINRLHNSPKFSRDPNAVYSQLVYAAKSTDVTDVMANGRWLMRDRRLLTINEADILLAAGDVAKKTDLFLIEREESVVSKLVAIGGATQEESFEIQIKVRLEDPSPVLAALSGQDLHIVRSAHYHEFDTYFYFASPAQGRLRYREDEFINEAGEVYNVRVRLTLIGPAREREYERSILLSRSRFIAPAVHSLRFYREYFQPIHELEIEKDRLRWLVNYQEEEVFVNLDRLLKPTMSGFYLEIKSRTWSRGDAEKKTRLIVGLMRQFGLGEARAVRQEYADIAEALAEKL